MKYVIERLLVGACGYRLSSGDVRSCNFNTQGQYIWPEDMTSISSVLMCVTGAETKTGDGAMGITQSSYVFSFELVFGMDYILASDETNDFTLRGFLETNLLRPVKMM